MLTVDSVEGDKVDDQACDQGTLSGKEALPSLRRKPRRKLSRISGDHAHTERLKSASLRFDNIDKVDDQAYDEGKDPDQRFDATKLHPAGGPDPAERDERPLETHLSPSDAVLLSVALFPSPTCLGESRSAGEDGFVAISIFLFVFLILFERTCSTSSIFNDSTLVKRMRKRKISVSRDSPYMRRQFGE